jgi:hypothetical protein
LSELVELANWFSWRTPYVSEPVDSLSGPAFMVKSDEHISFSSNNYLSIAASPRLKAAAVAGIEAYGVGNCESRLLTGDLALYGNLERKLARSKSNAGVERASGSPPRTSRCARRASGRDHPGVLSSSDAGQSPFSRERSASVQPFGGTNM